MSKLTYLRRQLAILRWSRAAARWAMAVGLAVLPVLLGLLVLFLLDVWWLEPTFRGQFAPRLAVEVLVLLVAAWWIVRRVRPLLARPETALEAAMLVERRAGIRSDLVAALQFEQVGANRWGSPQLEAAVVEGAARKSRELSVWAEVPVRPGLRVAATLLAVSLPWLLIGTFWPGYVGVFVQRLLGTGAHYPSRTRIVRVEVNGTPVLEGDGSRLAPGVAKVPHGRPLRITVQSRGRRPDAGSVQLVSRLDGRRRTLPLSRIAAGEDAGQADHYEAIWGRFLEPVVFQLELGDAWTDPAEIDLIEPPLVQMEWSIEPPDYARDAVREPPPIDTRRVVVLEGSRVALTLRSANGKRLDEAWLDLRAGDERRRIALRAIDDTGRVWQLPAEPTPLDRIAGEQQFELQVRDADGLPLEAPVRGSIRLRRDQAPTGTAAVVHRVVLPAARPVVEYRLHDDYGLAAAGLRIQVQRQAASQSPEPSGATDLDSTSQQFADPDGGERLVTEEVYRPLPLDRLPLPASELPASGQYPLALSELGLKKGDRLKISLELSDYRGTLPGQSHVADPLYLEISDESGVLDEISKADERSEERLTELIKQQLGIGEAP
ncbi:MAG: hypothetical protein J5I93_02545 [Pirellulaceae bacterium]|nr:hypothetical protein [Pirellulaceae bacterium]